MLRDVGAGWVTVVRWLLQCGGEWLVEQLAGVGQGAKSAGHEVSGREKCFATRRAPAARS